MNRQFAILTRNASGRWENTASIIDNTGLVRPETFRRRCHARRELQSQMAEMDQEGIDYNRSDYRVKAIAPRPSKKTRRYRSAKKGNAHAH